MEEKDNTLIYVVAGIAALVLIFFLFRKKNQSDPFNNIPGPTATSSGWISWHKDLLEAGLEKSEANRVFLNAFNKYGATNSQANDYNLRTYARTQGFEVPSYSVVSSVYDTTVDTGKALDKGFASVGTAVAIGSVIIAVGMGFVVYKLVKD